MKNKAPIRMPYMVCNNLENSAIFFHNTQFYNSEMTEMKKDENQIENVNSYNINNLDGNKNSDQTMQEDLPNTKSAHNLMKCNLWNCGERLNIF